MNQYFDVLLKDDITGNDLQGFLNPIFLRACFVHFYYLITIVHMHMMSYAT